MTPTVDVILATNNGERYLFDQLESIRRQTFNEFRLLVLDDGSDDASVEMVDSWIHEHRVSATILPAHRKANGPVAAYSELLDHFARMGNATYVALCDQDDVWHPLKLERFVAEMRRLEAVHGVDMPLLVHSDLRLVDRDGAALGESFWQFQNLDPRTSRRLNRLLAMNVVTGSAAMLNRPLARLVAPVPSEALMHDWWIALCAAAFGKVAWIRDPMVDYRQHDKNSVGASRYTWAATLARLWERVRSDDVPRAVASATRHAHLLRNLAQARAFLEAFEERLSSRQHAMLRAYCSLYEKPRLVRPLSMLRHRFWISGLLRNLTPLMTRRMVGSHEDGWRASAIGDISESRSDSSR